MSATTFSRFGRRSFLRGLAAGQAVRIALPTLDMFMNGNGTAFADETPLPKRFMVWFWANGIRKKYWIPKNVGPGWTPPELLEPLLPVKDHVSVITGLDVNYFDANRHAAGPIGMLMGSYELHVDGNSTPATPSVDQVIAGHIGGGTPLKSLGVKVWRDSSATGVFGTTSWRGPNSPNPGMADPRKVYARLVDVEGSGGVNPGRRVDQINLRKSALDACLQDARDLDRSLGQADRRRLAEHVEHLHAIERRLGLAGPKTQLAKPDPGSVITDETMKSVDPHGRLVNDAMSRVVAYALASDLTRVVHYEVTEANSGHCPLEAGINGHFHQITHDEPFDEDPMSGGITRSRKGIRFMMQLFADTLGIFAKTPDGPGSLLDASCILATSDICQGSDHNLDEMPCLIAGKARGALVHPGVHVRLTTADKQRMSGSVGMTLARAMGANIAYFGHKAGSHWYGSEHVIDGVLT